MGSADDIKNQAWDVLRDLGPRADVAGVIAELQRRGHEVAWRDLYVLGPLLPSGSVGPLPPPVAVEFVSAYLDRNGVESVFNPYCGFGPLLLGALEAGAVRSGLGMDPSKAAVSAAKALARGVHGASFRVGDPAEPVRDEQPSLELGTGSTYGAVVSCPPVAGRGTRWVVDLLSELGRALADDAPALYVLPTGALTPKVREGLRHRGLYVAAILELPLTVTARPTGTGVRWAVAVVGREPAGDLFVGKLDEDTLPTLLDNLGAGTQGPLPELGALAPPEGFRSLEALKDQGRLEALALRSGAVPVRLADIADSVVLGKRADSGGFVDHDRAVYLPAVGRSPAVLDVADGEIASQNYVQITLSEDAVAGRVRADYLVAYLNSPMGILNRSTWETGTTIPRVTRSSLQDAHVYLPPLEVQGTVVKVEADIQQLQFQLEQVERRLWERPVNARAVAKDLTRINRDHSLAAWIDVLPFPIASVLRKAHVENDPQDKFGHLVRFFEASAQFMGTVVLSAVLNDDELRDRYVDGVKGGESKGPSLRLSTFGGWQNTHATLSKLVRPLLNSTDERGRVLAAFRVGEVELVEAVTAKGLASTFERANVLRNDWKGHSGVVSRALYEELVEELGVLLAALREEVGDLFLEWDLVRPLHSKYRGGVHYTDVESLVGAHNIFERREVATTVPLDADRLHLLGRQSDRSLELLPFFKMAPSPKSHANACYFFSKLGNGTARWVSHYFEPEPELQDAGDQVRTVIDMIEGRGGE